MNRQNVTIMVNHLLRYKSLIIKIVEVTSFDKKPKNLLWFRNTKKKRKLSC